MKTLIEHDAANGRSVYAEDSLDGLIITKTFDKSKVKAHLDGNKQSYNNVSHKGFKAALRKKNIWKAASIPNSVVEMWLKEGIDVFNDNHWEKVKAKLNSDEFKYLRTSPGKL